MLGLQGGTKTRVGVPPHGSPACQVRRHCQLDIFPIGMLPTRHFSRLCTVDAAVVRWRRQPNHYCKKKTQQRKTPSSLSRERGRGGICVNLLLLKTLPHTNSKQGVSQQLWKVNRFSVSPLAWRPWIATLRQKHHPTTTYAQRAGTACSRQYRPRSLETSRAIEALFLAKRFASKAHLAANMGGPAVRPTYVDARVTH